MKSSDKDVIALLKEDITDISVYHEQVKLHGLINIFIISTNNEEVLKNSWEKIRNRVAVYFQRHLESEFERWNLYLLFVCPDVVKKTLKYKIENDRVSSRKIVVDQFEEKLNKDSMLFLINNYINFSFSMPIETKEVKHTYSSNSDIYKLIKEKPIPQSETKRRNELDKLYLKILKALS